MARSLTKSVIKEVRRLLSTINVTTLDSVFGTLHQPTQGSSQQSVPQHRQKKPLFCRVGIVFCSQQAFFGHTSCSQTLLVQARAKELRLELLNSERLKAHFEAHPGDLALLRHDKVPHINRAA